MDKWLTVVCPLSWSGSPKCLYIMLEQSVRRINPGVLLHALRDRMRMSKVSLITCQLWQEHSTWVLRLPAVHQGQLVSKQLTQTIHWGMNSLVRRLEDPLVLLSTVGCSVKNSKHNTISGSHCGRGDKTAASYLAPLVVLLNLKSAKPRGFESHGLMLTSFA